MSCALITSYLGETGQGRIWRWWEHHLSLIMSQEKPGVSCCFSLCLSGLAPQVWEKGQADPGWESDLPVCLQMSHAPGLSVLTCRMPVLALVPQLPRFLGSSKHQAGIMISVSRGMLSVSGTVGGCVLAWKGLGASRGHRPVARPASLFLDSGRGWSPREAWHCSEHGQGWAGADSSHARGHLGGRKQLKGVLNYRREDSMITMFGGKAGVHFWESSWDSVGALTASPRHWEVG